MVFFASRSTSTVLRKSFVLTGCLHTRETVMKNFPFWKIKRELKRVQRSGADLVRGLLRDPRRDDAGASTEILRSVGVDRLETEVAIYLIYPEYGVLASHLFMLRELKREGISPIVVSNLPLSDHDRDQLLAHATRIIERPNIGYDFGGYRDGILELAAELPGLDRLWLLNDSVWMVPRGDSWFAQARAINRDFTGATSSFSILRKTLFGAKRFDAASYRNIVWSHQTDNPNFHYGSYALCIAAPILKDPRFLCHWRQMVLGNGKKHAVRHGEIGLTQWVLKHGFSHGATHEIADLPESLASLRDDEIDQTARELILFKETPLTRIRPDVLMTPASTAAGRAERIDFILTAVARHGSAYALALYYLRQTQFPFLKKSPLWLSSEGAVPILTVANEVLAPQLAEVCEEAQMLSLAKGCGSDETSS